MLAGSLLKVGNGVLPAGSEYDFYDLTDSTNVNYWLEAVDINAQSRWFGPVYPQFSFEEENAKKESETISALNNQTEGFRQQIDTVDFLTPVLKKNDKQSIQSVESNLITMTRTRLKSRFGIAEFTALTRRVWRIWDLTARNPPTGNFSSAELNNRWLSTLTVRWSFRTRN